MRKEVAARVDETLEQRRSIAEQTARANYERALQDEEFKRADRELRAVVMAIEKAAAKGKTVDELNNREISLRADWFAQAKRLNLDTSTLKPHYYCPLCNDLGRVNGRACECYNTLYRAYVRQACELDSKAPYRFSDCDYSVFKDETQRKNMEALGTALLAYSEKFPSNNRSNILLLGKVGVGKTFLASAVANAVCDKGYFVAYYSAFGFNQLCAKHRVSSFDSDLLEEPLYADLLVIDDLGSEPIFKNVTLEYLHLILSERQSAGKATFVTTNLSLEQLMNRYGERVYSRLTSKQNTFIKHLDGADVRH